MSASVSDIKNFVQVDERTGTAGQPTPAQFKAVRDAGYEAVVNLLPREQDNALKNEADVIAALGLAYHYIPVVWAAPQPQDFAAFCDVLRALEDRKAFIHCALNMRVTAFYSSYALKHRGWTSAQADALVWRIWGEGAPRMDETWRTFIARIRA